MVHTMHMLAQFPLLIRFNMVGTITGQVLNVILTRKYINARNLYCTGLLVLNHESVIGTRLILRTISRVDWYLGIVAQINNTHKCVNQYPVIKEALFNKNGKDQDCLEQR